MVRLKVEIHGGCIHPDAPLVRLALAFAANLEALPEFQACCSASGDPADAPDVQATILLCDGGAFDLWDAPPGCIGAHAITSGPFLDEDDEEESGYMRRHLVAVNLDTSAAGVRELLEEGEDPILAVEAWAATVSHEGGHLAEFIRVAGGRTPHEMFLQEGEWALHKARTLEGTEWDPVESEDEEDDADREEMAEERVEALARSWTPLLMPGSELVEEVAASFDGPPAASAG